MQTSSYISAGKLTTNTSCYATFCRETTSSNTEQLIVIEEGKSPYDDKTIRRWLRHLKLMGFDFNFTYDKDNNRYLINTSKITDQGDKWFKTTFCMLVRFLWEGSGGKNGSSYMRNYDEFYKVIPYYFELVNYKPSYNKVALLCMACNNYQADGPNYNSNHFLSYGMGTVIRTVLPFNKAIGVNSYFSNVDSTRLNIFRRNKAKEKITTNKELAEFTYKFYTNVKE